MNKLTGDQIKEIERQERELLKKAHIEKCNMLSDNVVIDNDNKIKHQEVLNAIVKKEKLEEEKQMIDKEIVNRIILHCESEIESLGKKLDISNMENFKKYIGSKLIEIIKSDVDYCINIEKNELLAVKKFVYIEMKEGNSKRTF